MVASLKIARQVEDRIADATRKNLAHEVQFQLNKAADAAKQAPIKKA